MSFIIKQKIKNQVYLYQVESYWDKEKKQPRQKRVYLGKKGLKTKEIISPKKVKISTSYTCKEYGSFYFLNEISKKIGLTKILKEIFINDWEKILTCAFFEICEGKPLYLCNAWLGNTYNEFIKDLPSQRISELLKQLGEDYNNRIRFLKLWAQRNKKDNKYIVFDISSISSYSKQVSLVEWGYNRDKEKLPQINLGIIIGEPSSLPIFYNIYQGSIQDVSTLENILNFIEHFELENIIFILDKGFYSSHNLKRMSQKGLKFIIPLPFSTNLSTEIIQRHIDDIQMHINSFQFRDRILFCIKDKVEIEGRKFYIYLYFDEKKKSEELERFLKKVIEFSLYVKEINFKKRVELEKYLSETFCGWKKIFKIKEVEGRFEIERKDEEITEKLNTFGKMILLYNFDIEQKEVLSFYRRKDKLEKIFDNIKNELNMKRLRVHSEEATEGRLFLSFISLILYSFVGKIMEEENLYKEYTIEEVIYELKKLKVIEISDERKILSEISKKQKDLFGSFNLEIPKT